MNMARCLQFEEGLAKVLWDEAVNTAIYLENRLPTRVVEGKTTYEAQIGTKSSVSHLKVFGCICYSYILEVKRDKLDQRAEVGIFVGYSSTSKRYLILKPISQQIHVREVLNLMRIMELDEDGCFFFPDH